MMKTTAGLLVLLSTISVAAQAPTPTAQVPLPATDVKGSEIKAFIDKLPKDVISDLPIRTVDVGWYRAGI